MPAPPRADSRHRRRDSRAEAANRPAGRRHRHHVDRPARHRASLVAARFIAEVVDVRRYPDRNAFAAANGTAPPPASSGRTLRHRFNPGGNGQLNRALYTIAITQIRGDTEGRAYYERKRAAGKTRREALRCLKRKPSDIVFTTMRRDAAKASASLRPLTLPTETGVGAAVARRHV